MNSIFTVFRRSESAGQTVFLRAGGGWTVKYPDAEKFDSENAAWTIAEKKNADGIFKNYGEENQLTEWV